MYVPCVTVQGQTGQGDPDQDIRRTQDTRQGCQAETLSYSYHLVRMTLQYRDIDAHPYLTNTSRSALRLRLVLRAALSSGFTDHCQGHKSSATIVMVVSRQLDKVLVEQNHCHGLTTVKANCTQHKLSFLSLFHYAKESIPLSRSYETPHRTHASQISRCKNPQRLRQRPALSWEQRRGDWHASRERHEE